MNRADRHSRRDAIAEARGHPFAAAGEAAPASLAWLVLVLVAGTFTMFNLSGNVWPDAAADAATPRPPQCEALEARIHAIDAQARQALSAAEQERIASARKQARDAQSKLKC